MCILGSTSSRSMLYADGLVACSFIVRGPSRGEWRRSVLQLFARPVLWPTLSHSLTLCGQDWSQNTWSLHEQGMGR